MTKRTIRRSGKISGVTLAVLGLLFTASLIVILSQTTNRQDRASIDRSVPSALTLTNPTSGNVEVGKTQDVRWTSSNYEPLTVSINVIKRVGTNPDRYELVRTVSLATLNDGLATWVPAKTDVSNDVVVEVGCKLSSHACTSGSNVSSPLAVIDTGRYADTAAIYDAIEQMENK